MEDVVNQLQKEMRRNEQNPQFITEYEKYIQLSNRLAEMGLSGTKPMELMPIEKRHAYKRLVNQTGRIKPSSSFGPFV